MATQTPDSIRHRQETDESAGVLAGDRLGRLWQVAAGVVGTALLVRGLRRRGLRGLGMAAAGGWLVARAVGRGPQLTDLLPAGSTLQDSLADRTTGPEQTSVTRTITVGESAEDLYDLWRDPVQLSRVVGHFAGVTETDEDHLRWTVDMPGGRDVSWETEIVADEPGDHVRWEAPEDAMIATSGAVRFRPAPGDRGTEVELTIDFDPPGGVVGTAAIDRLDVLPEAVVGTALRRFKSLAETGEIPTLEDNPSGRGRGDLV